MFTSRWEIEFTDGLGVKVTDPLMRVFFETDYATGWQREHWLIIVEMMNARLASGIKLQS